MAYGKGRTLWTRRFFSTRSPSYRRPVGFRIRATRNIRTTLPLHSLKFSVAFSIPSSILFGTRFPTEYDVFASLVRKIRGHLRGKLYDDRSVRKTIARTNVYRAYLRFGGEKWPPVQRAKFRSGLVYVGAKSTDVVLFPSTSRVHRPRTVRTLVVSARADTFASGFSPRAIPPFAINVVTSTRTNTR